jgi:hypothetical protein
VIWRPASSFPRVLSTQSASSQIYIIGDPTDEEQLYLEFLNRARANPTAEGLIFKNTTDPLVTGDSGFQLVDLNLMANEFATNPVAPPLSMNALLLISAREHSQDQFTNQFQGHTNSTPAGTLFDARYNALGYNFMNAAENVFINAQSVFHGHAAFEVDWSGVTNFGGMQNPPGHRDNIHDSILREVGVGVVDGFNATNASLPAAGPQTVTQDFGTVFSSTPFITGVVYYDLNTNHFYGLGEGIPGVMVTVNGMNAFAVSTNSGGYSVPVTVNGAYTVNFAGHGLSLQTNVTVSGGNNLKVDFVLPYSPPVISGPSLIGVGQNSAFTFTPVAGATGYQVKQVQTVPYTFADGAENGLGNFTAATSSGYSVITTDKHHTGASSFHLAHAQPVPQTLALNQVFRPTVTSQLSFFSELGTATPDEVARVQVSIDGGVTWQDISAQPGAGQPGETTFTQHTVSLGPFAGQDTMLRFNFDFFSGGFFNQTSAGFGWYIDDISISNANKAIGTVTNDLPANANFTFNPSSAGGYNLSVRAKIDSRLLPFGPAAVANATSSTIQITQTQLVNGQATISFTVTPPQPSGTTLALQSAPTVTGAWSSAAGANLQTIVTGSQFRFTTSAAGQSNQIYRVQMTSP